MSSSEHVESVIECKNVVKIYRDWSIRKSSPLTALEDVSLSIAQGRTVGLVGPNGAGKSTLLGLIAGFILPTRGSVEVCGHPARSIEARRILGYMPESPVFQGLYTARQVLCYHGALLRLPRKQAQGRAEQLLTRLDLLDAADRRCFGFSMGMRQRLALGVALMGEPRVLLLDEPSNGLDPSAVVKLRELLRDLTQSGMTLFISSHRLDELDKVSSEFVFLKHGHVMLIDEECSERTCNVVRIGVLASGRTPLEELLRGYRFSQICEGEIQVEIDQVRDIPGVVSRLAGDGAQIISVTQAKEGVESAFLRLCDGATK